MKRRYLCSLCFDQRKVHSLGIRAFHPGLAGYDFNIPCPDCTSYEEAERSLAYQIEYSQELMEYEDDFEEESNGDYFEGY